MQAKQSAAPPAAEKIPPTVRTITIEIEVGVTDPGGDRRTHLAGMLTRRQTDALRRLRAAHERRVAGAAVPDIRGIDLVRWLLDQVADVVDRNA